MNLELAIALNCAKTGCRVRLVRNGEVVTANYSVAVQDRIWIRKNQLVAIDVNHDVPEIVWRWVMASLVEVNEETVGIKDNQGHLGFAVKVAALPLTLKPGDKIWFCNTDQALEIHDLIVAGKPAHPERLLAYISPIIARVYAWQ